MNLLAKAQVEATKAKTKIGNLHGIIQGSTNTALLAHGLQPGTCSALAHTSQAEQTLRTYHPTFDTPIPGVRPGFDTGKRYGYLGNPLWFECPQRIILKLDVLKKRTKIL